MAATGERTAGFLLPTRERAIAGDWDAAALVDLAVAAEARGFDSVWVGDSLTARPRVEPLTLLAAIAARTRRVALGTAALTAALRPAVLGAATVATLDRLAGGRLVLGLGAGFPDDATAAEFAHLGVPFPARSARLAEVVDGWRSAWRGEVVAGFPEPTAPTGPQLWLAGGGSAAMRLAARSFDGWLPYLPSPAAYRDASLRLDDLAEAAGRSPGDLERALYVTVLVDGAPGEVDAWADAYYGVPARTIAGFQAVVTGSLDACAGELAAFGDAGARHLVLRIGSLDTHHHLEAAADLARRWRGT